MAEKVDELKKKEEKKSFLERTWQRMKKPLTAGVLTAGLLMTPMKGEAIRVEDAIGPPVQMEDFYKKEYPKGWKYIVKADELQSKGKNAKIYSKLALEEFTKAYEKDKNAETHFMKAYSNYSLAIDQDTITEAKPYFEKVIELCEEGIELYGKSDLVTASVYVDLELYTIHDLVQCFFEEYKKTNSDKYKQEIIDNSKRYLEIYNKYFDLLKKSGCRLIKEYEDYVKQHNEILNQL